MLKSWISLLIVLSVRVTPELVAQRVEPEPRGELRLSAVLRSQSLAVLPVALTRFVAIAEAGDTTVLDTDKDGIAVAVLAPGVYVVQAAAPVELDGKSYTWHHSVTIDVGGSVSVQLSNLNAAIEEGRRRSRSDGLPTPEERIFRALSGAVLRVEAGLGHGSGFVVDSLGGVVLTSAHVIGTAADSAVSIYIDSLTRVPAFVLARDNDADVAVLRISTHFLHDLPRLQIQEPDAPRVTPGERVVALGYPLAQGLTITSGIASGIREGAIISDVNMNPGSSGGPLLDLDGRVVAINTFSDAAKNGVGPGISGSVLIERADQALRRAAQAPNPDSTWLGQRLPAMPLERLNAANLRSAAASWDYESYIGVSVVDLHGRFTVEAQTPLATFVRVAEYEREIARDRRKREQAAGLVGDERYSALAQYRDWIRYVGHLTTPVITLVVRPNRGETGGSAFTRVLTAALTGGQTQATLKFKGDVRDVRLYLGDSATLVAPLRGGHEPIEVLVENSWVKFKDVADFGVYVFDPEVFRPSDDGTPPIVVVAVWDLIERGGLWCRVLPPAMVARSWNDFREYYREYRSDQSFPVADPKRRRDDDAIKDILRNRELCTF